MKYLLMIVMLSGMGLAQAGELTKCDGNVCSGSMATSSSSIISIGAATSSKKCAFGLTPQVLSGMGKRKPLTPKEEFSEASTGAPNVVNAMAYYHVSCPYERAIELFGEDRVTFEEARFCKDKLVCSDDPARPEHKNVMQMKRVLVDGEVVYEE